MYEPKDSLLWICRWWYSDNSASGVFPKILTNSEKELIELAEKTFHGFNVLIEFTSVDLPGKANAYRGQDSKRAELTQHSPADGEVLEEIGGQELSRTPLKPGGGLLLSPGEGD